jgi:hypothetical protein
MRPLALLMLIASGCGPVDDTPAPEVFIALPRDFRDYAQWTHFTLPPREVVGSPHLAGESALFINRIPPSGSTAFPIGTIIVKRLADETQSFAMVKRGGGYNSAGASGWEWFEIKPAADGTPVIVWRGITPPAGEMYHGVSGGECNLCHEAGRANDFVQSEPLLLTGF